MKNSTTTNYKELDEMKLEEKEFEEMMLDEMQLDEMNMDDKESSFDAFKAYMESISKIPLLSKEEESELGRRISRGGEEAIEAKSKLAQANLRLVVMFAKKYKNSGMDIQELIAMGNEGLLKACEKYDYTRDTRFATCAGWWIQQSITRGIAKEKNTVRIPHAKREFMYKVQKAQRTLQACLGVAPTNEELAHYLNTTTEKIEEVQAFIPTSFSLDREIGDEGEDTFYDFIKDENALDPCEASIQKDCREVLIKVLNQLSPKEALVLKYRNGFDCERCMSLEEIANLEEMGGISRERVRQIEAKAIRKIASSPSMRRMLEDYVA